MSEHDARIRVDRIDWPSVLPWLVLFRTIRMALHPAKLLLALLLVALLYMGGMAMDVLWGGQVFPDETSHYRLLDTDQFDRWAQAMAEHRADAIEQEREVERLAGLFETTLDQQRHAFTSLMRSAVTFDFGVGDLLGGRGLQSGGVVGALGYMFISVPGWLLHTHPAFLLIYLAWAFIITAILGGAIARLAALHACRDQRGSIIAAVRFVATRYPWFFLTPLIPIGLIAVVALLLMIVGIGFNLPGLDLLAAVAYGLLLVCGAVAALLLVGLATAGNLLFPSLAVEGTDAFDAVSRAYNYVFGRPWQYLFYTTVSLIYGALGYLLLSLFLFLLLWLTWTFAGQWVFAALDDPDISRFEAMLAAPSPIQLLPMARPDELGAIGSVASIVLRGWTNLIIALLPAFALSFYFCAHTWIYLLLRRAADGTELDDLFIEAEPDATAPPEKLEPPQA